MKKYFVSFTFKKGSQEGIANATIECDPIIDYSTLINCSNLLKQSGYDLVCIINFIPLQ